MKLILIALFAIIVVISAAPSQITNNNVGDIVNVGIDADLDIVNKIDLTKVNIEVILRNLQAIILALGGDDDEGSRRLTQVFSQLLQQQE